MKKTLFVMLLSVLLSLTAYADAAAPGIYTPAGYISPIVLILCVLVAVAAVIIAIRLIRKNKKK